jgi:hypothetical protein
MSFNTLSLLERQPKSVSFAEPEIPSATFRQVRWLAARFGLSVDQAKVIAGLAFTTGRRA